MNSYFEVGVRYDKTMENGVVRKVTENYLLDALSFTEAEKRATEEMEAYICGVQSGNREDCQHRRGRYH